VQHTPHVSGQYKHLGSSNMIGHNGNPLSAWLDAAQIRAIQIVAIMILA
jgi:hypothetical protein